MSYVIKASLSNAQHPEHERITIPFPIPVDQYDQAIASLKEADQKKLNAVICMAEPGDMMAVRQLAENLDQFDFIPGIQTPEEYGKYMIQQSGRFEYDEDLEGFYDYRRYGEKCVRQEGGQFNACGYVAYHGTMTLEELMMEDPAEQSQRGQGIQMGGLSG